MKIRCNLTLGEWFLELDCRSFHADPENAEVYCFMAPEWEAPYNEAASHILGSVLCHLNADGTRPILSAHADRSTLSCVRIVNATA